MLRASRRANALALAACGATALALKLLLVWHYHVDSDEPQHMHVVWAWTHGLLPYRDVFDNHTPLFHLLMVPVLRLLGARPDIVIWGRVIMVPLWMLAIGLTFVIARTIDGAARAAWCAVLVAALPIFTTRTTEFRTDDLWTVVWLAAVALLLARRPSTARTFVVCVLLGLAVTVSMKTTLLLVTVLVASAFAPFVAGRRAQRPSLARGCAGAIGLTVPPTIVAAYFWGHDALGPLWYGVVEHNLLPERAGVVAARLVVLTLAIVGVAVAARSTASGDTTHGLARAWLMLVTGTYLALVVIGWPARTPQTFLPIMPLVIVLAVSTAGRLLDARRPSRPVPVGAFVMVFVLEAAVTGVHARAWQNDAARQVQLVAEVLKLTSPDDYVFDFKGEAIFRRRPYYLVFESFTRRRVALGLLRDDVADRLIETRTCVTVPVTMPGLERTAVFINAHYLAVGGWLVAGAILTPNQGRAEFEVPFSAPYIVVGRTGPVAGWVDGRSNARSQLLTAGRHVFVAASSETAQVALIWGPAAERGFSPFGAAESLARH
jgi:hypothetical protein